MSYTFKQNLVSTNKYSIKCPYNMQPIGICVHNTYNDAPAKNEVAYMISNNNQVSFHVAIDDNEAVQGIPFERNAWHAGDGNFGNGNRKYISVEICYSKSGGDKFIQSEKNAAEWIAKTLKEHNWTISNVKKHQDFSGKYCPHRTLDMGWQRFLDMIQNELDKINTPTISHKYSVGQYVTFGTSYPSPTSPCGITYATGGSGNGLITAIVSGQAKYQIDNGARYCNDGDIRGTYTPQPEPSVAPSTPTPKVLNVNAYYKVFAGGRWYSEVKNLEDYAGDAKNAIRAIAIKVDNGSVKYRVHVRGGNWYPYVTGYNPADGNNGYAGDGRNDIDAVEVYFTTPSGYQYKKAKYRVAPIGGNYYSWQTDNDKGNGMDGYAGAFGKSFGKFQLVIE